MRPSFTHPARFVPLWVALATLTSSQPLVAGPCSITPSPLWKTTIDFPDDPFRVNSGGPSEPGWVKLTLLTCDPGTVYFQDGTAYEFHYDFATEVLDPFLGLTLEEFDAVTLYNEGRQALLGAVVLPPTGPPGSPTIPEYGIQLVGFDPLDPQFVVDSFNTIKAAVSANPGVQAFYFPTFEQLASVQQNAAFFEANGIVVSSPARWADGNSCYSEGWALGRLKFLPADQIEAAFLAGDLAFDDILLTDGVPADMPLVAGVISTEPAAPNSHVVILANTFQIPFVFTALADDAERAQQLVGRRIVLRSFAHTDVFDLGGACEVRMIDVEDELSEQQIAEILSLKVPPPLDLAPIEPFGAYSAPTDVLVQSDIDHFGGKASNFGTLRRSIPSNVPRALGLSFDLWTEFLDQTMPGGSTLRQQIAGVLAAYPTFPPPDLQLLADELQAIRDAIEDDTSFTSAQTSAILGILQQPQLQFDPFEKLRFRSSTNVEDSEQFTGAGLYDSFSGCLADDLDADTSGPSLCDPEQPKERGVFRAIRKVYASFYNVNAFLERLRHGVDENDVGMALLVHHSFPDELELANGVATYTRDASTGDTALLVTQIGAESVTNPSPGALPEQAEAKIVSPTSIFVNFLSASNLVPLGAKVMAWTTDYVELAGLLREAADRFETETGKTEFVLDFEYKKLDPGGAALAQGGLVVKQIREIPQPDPTPSITPFLVNEPTELRTEAGGLGRTRTQWTVQTRSMWLAPVDLATQSIYTDLEMEFTDGCRVLTLDGTIPGLPQAAHSYNAGTWQSFDSWVVADIPNPRTYTLRTSGLGTLVSPAESPILTLSDLVEPFAGLHLTVEHQDPLPPYPGATPTTNPDVVGLVLAEDGSVSGASFTFGGISIETQFILAPPPPVCAGCTPRASRFVETILSGLTTEPIVLDGFYSQGYIASPHAFQETFRFEPILEPGLSLQALTELEAQDLRVIEVFRDNIQEMTSLSLWGDADVGQTCAPAGPAGTLSLPSSLRLDKAPGDEVRLTWGPSCTPADDDFEIYEGALGDFASHVPRVCSTAGAFAETIAPAAGDMYYLVVPRNAHFEGSYGKTSAAVERYASVMACYARELGGCP